MDTWIDMISYMLGRYLLGSEQGQLFDLPKYFHSASEYLDHLTLAGLGISAREQDNQGGGTREPAT